MRKRRHTRRNYQVLRENESPQGVNCIFYQSAERLTRLCGAGAPFRPLFLTPFHRSLFRGTKDFPNHHWVQRPSDNRRSIRESMGLVNSIPSKKYIRSVGLFLALLHAPPRPLSPCSCLARPSKVSILISWRANLKSLVRHRPKTGKRASHPRGDSIRQITQYLQLLSHPNRNATRILLLAPSSCLPHRTSPQGVSSLPTPPTCTALPHPPTHLHFLRLSNFHREYG